MSSHPRYPGSGQWASHHQSLYNRMTNNNHAIRSLLTDIQVEHYHKLWAIQSETYTELLTTTDYPDGLAEVVAENKILKLVLKSEQ